MKKYILVVYKYSDEYYRRVMGKPTNNRKKLAKAMAGLDRQLGDGFYSVVEEVEDED